MAHGDVAIARHHMGARMIRAMLKRWWRGWDESDLASLRAKMLVVGPCPGAWVDVTARELRASIANPDIQPYNVLITHDPRCPFDLSMHRGRA